MRTNLFIFFLSLSLSVQAQSVLDSALYTQADADIFEDIIARFSSQSDQPVGVLIPEIGRYFLGDTYVSHTLEVSDKEQLIVNLREMDCTTYAENLFALARTLKSKQHTFEQFAKELRSIRYRNGVLNQYPSRLHYFSEWIYSNRDQHLVSTPADSFGQPFPNAVNFMSTHPESYRHLSGNPEFIRTIKEQESAINSSSYWYIPKESIATFESELQEGDIIGLTTSIKGLDVAHVGVIVEVNGRMHLIHASQSSQKVEISKEPISSFLKPNSKNTGIMVARPVNLSDQH